MEEGRFSQPYNKMSNALYRRDRDKLSQAFDDFLTKHATRSFDPDIRPPYLAYAHYLAENKRYAPAAVRFIANRVLFKDIAPFEHGVFFVLHYIHTVPNRQERWQILKNLSISASLNPPLFEEVGKAIFKEVKRTPPGKERTHKLAEFIKYRRSLDDQKPALKELRAFAKNMHRSRKTQESFLALKLPVSSAVAKLYPFAPQERGTNIFCNRMIPS